MNRKITKQQTTGMLLAVCDKIIVSEPELTRIDISSGDGDHGVGMKAGFSSVKKMLETEEFDSVPSVFKAVGMKLIDVMGGASGVIFGTLFISGLNNLKEMDFLDISEFSEMLAFSAQSIMQRGGAREGDKTMLDALCPAVKAMAAAAKEGEPFALCAEKAFKAAAAGFENTKSLTAKKGRAAMFTDKAAGKYDAGALSVKLIFEAVYEFIKPLSF